MNGQSANYQTFKRAMNATEQKSVDMVYRNAQRQARPLGIFALIFAAIGFVTGAGTFDFSTSKGMTSIMILMVGIGAFLYSGYILRIRRNVADAKRSGQVVVVRGTVSRFNGRGNTTAAVVGPLSIGLGKGIVNTVLDGSMAEIACVPNLKSVVSINGAGLDRPIKLMIPAGLAANATEVPPTYPEYAPKATESSAPGTRDSTGFCFSCGQASAGLAFCSNCGTKL